MQISKVLIVVLCLSAGLISGCGEPQTSNPETNTSSNISEPEKVLIAARQAVIDENWESYCKYLSKDSQESIINYLTKARISFQKSGTTLPAGAQQFPKGKINCQKAWKFYAPVSLIPLKSAYSSSEIESVEENGNSATITTVSFGKPFDTDMIKENEEWKLVDKSL